VLPGAASEDYRLRVPQMDETEEKPQRKRGFAAMSPDRLKEIARKGGASIPPHKRAFSVDRDLAASAGRRGGKRAKPADD
jgi:general stress protein YciG